MKTQAEIEAQIKALENVKEKVVPASAFGDNHLDAIDAQIQVLERDMESDEIHDEYGDGIAEQNVLTAALDAREWKDGESDTEDLSTDYPLKTSFAV